MRYITGSDRTQAVLFPQSLEQIIDGENEVRLIDLFVESLEQGLVSERSFICRGNT